MPPKRAARVLDGYTLLGRPIDIVETSRGCTYDCSFCSIIEMRGRNFHTWPIERVVADIRDARDRGARAIFLVDDNITLNVARFRALCEAIIAHGLNDVDYIVQAMTSAIASAGDELASGDARAPASATCSSASRTSSIRTWRSSRPRPRTPGAKAAARLAARPTARSSCCTGTACSSSAVSSSAIPATREASIQANLDFARKYVDWPYIQHPTPYPGTPMTKDFREKSLIVNDEVDEYDGTTAVVRTEHLSADDIEFMRWKAERWMKVRHLPAALAHDPGFVARNGLRMLRHNFRGTTLRTWLGLESQHDAFRRYKAIRRAEREFFPDASASGGPGPTVWWQASTGKPSELVAPQTSPGRRISV